MEKNVRKRRNEGNLGLLRQAIFCKIVVNIIKFMVGKDSYYFVHILVNEV
jgi:hypothetical protein